MLSINSSTKRDGEIAADRLTLFVIEVLHSMTIDELLKVLDRLDRGNLVPDKHLRAYAEEVVNRIVQVGTYRRK